MQLLTAISALALVVALTSIPRRIRSALCARQVQRVPMLVGVALSGIADVASAVPAAVFVGLGFVAVLIAYALYRLVRPSVCEAERGALRWLLPGAVLSLTLTAGPPSARLLLFPSIGSSFLIAVLICRGSQQLAIARPRWPLRVGCGFLVAMHLVLAPVALVVGAIQLGDNARQARDAFYRAEFDHFITRQVVVLAAPDLTAVTAGTMVQAFATGPPPAWHILSMADGDHRFTRTGPASFRLDVIGRAHSFVQNFLRSPAEPVHVGDRVDLTGATVTVCAVWGAIPTSLDVTTDVPLDSPSLALLTWRDGRFVRFAPPLDRASVEVSSTHG